MFRDTNIKLSAINGFDIFFFFVSSKMFFVYEERAIYIKVYTYAQRDYIAGA